MEHTFERDIGPFVLPLFSFITSWSPYSYCGTLTPVMLLCYRPQRIRAQQALTDVPEIMNWNKPFSSVVWAWPVFGYSDGKWTGTPGFGSPERTKADPFLDSVESAAPDTGCHTSGLQNCETAFSCWLKSSGCGTLSL